MAKKESAAQAPAKKKKAVEEARPFTEAARLRVKYNEEVVPQLKEKFGYTNVMQIPKLEKIVLNMGLGSDKDNPKGIESFDDMAAGLKDGTILLGMGNSDVPVGQYTQKVLKFYELDEETLAAAGCLTYGTNVKEVTTQVSEAVVDCGVIYCTDAFSAGLTIVDYATAEMCGQVIYPAAVLNVSKNVETAQAFLDFCRTPEATAIFESVGFSAAE